MDFPHESSPPFWTSMIAGASAGATVDIALYPMDTIKTRLQSAKGFMGSGGFRGVYSGLLATAGGSAPGAALFFVTYEKTKEYLSSRTGWGVNSPLIHVLASSLGECIACLVRVPTENIKQKMQAGLTSTTSHTLKFILINGGLAGFYAGYFTTLLREVPFSAIQFPLYEHFKHEWAELRGRETSPPEMATCGAVAGGIAAGLTTPMDVIKTRLMLINDAEGKPYRGFLDAFARITQKEGVGTLFSGIGPRVTWITIGGFVFFGTYEASKKLIHNLNKE